MQASPDSPISEAGISEAGVSDARLVAAAEGLRAGRYRVLSVDIFDTLVWRRVPEPTDVFLMLGGLLRARGKLAPGIGPVAFAQARRTAERGAREKAQGLTGYREVKLADIYALIPDQMFTADCDIPARAAAEVACEQKLLTFDRDIAALMAVAKAAGARVILVSDTYFTSPEIHALLKHTGFDAAFVDRLYVSCETGRPKYRDLFDSVLADLAIPPGEIIHIGDNYDADVAPCAARKMAAVHYDKWHFAPRVQAKEFPADIAARETLFGATGDFGLTGLRSRLRHRAPAEMASALRPYWQIGAAALAPVFAGFARWAVGTAQGRGVTRIYGLMREGRFLGDLLTATAAAVRVPLVTEELWLSRRAVIGAALYADDLSLLPDFIMTAPGESSAAVLEKIGLAPDDLPGFDIGRHGALATLVGAITGTPTLRAKVLAVSAAHRRNLLAGLSRQFDLAKPQTITVMDLGYAATIQAVLSRVLAREGAAVTVSGLYLALNDTGLARRNSGLALDAFLGAGAGGLAAGRLLSRTPDVLEHACMCREGSLAAYDDAGAPLLLANQRSEAQLAQMEALQAGIRAGTAAVNDLLGGFAETPAEAPGLALQAARMIEGLILHPTPEEAATVGAWHHEANFDLSDRRRLTDLAFDPSALEYGGLPALQEIGRHQAYWPAAALARINPFLAEAFAAGASNGYGPAQLTSGPLLGGLTIVPDLGVGVDPRRGGTVPLAVNALGRGEITLTVKPFGADVYPRLKLTWPAVAAVAAVDGVSIICRGEREAKGLGIKTQAWAGTTEILPGVHMTGAAAELVLEFEAPPAFAHALELTLRFKYLRLDPVFGGRA